MTYPALTVVIPFYNAGPYIFEAVASVEQCPDTSVYEIVIVDDGSTQSDSLSALEANAADRLCRAAGVAP